jgi:hypothetical protein
VNLTPVSESWANEDLSWLGSAHGVEMADSITLDRAGLDAAWVTLGYVPAGAIVRRLAATGRYHPFAGGDAAAGIVVSPIMIGAAGNPVGAVIRHGQVIVAKLPASSGYAGGVAATLPLVDFI